MYGSKTFIVKLMCALLHLFFVDCPLLPPLCVSGCTRPPAPCPSMFDPQSPVCLGQCGPGMVGRGVPLHGAVIIVDLK